MAKREVIQEHIKDKTGPERKDQSAYPWSHDPRKIKDLTLDTSESTQISDSPLNQYTSEF